MCLLPSAWWGMSTSTLTFLKCPIHPSVSLGSAISTFVPYKSICRAVSIHTCPSIHPFLAVCLPMRTDPPGHLTGTARRAAKSSWAMWTASEKMLLSQAAAEGTFVLIHSPPLPHPPFEGESPAMMRWKGPAGSTLQQDSEYTARETSVPKVFSLCACSWGAYLAEQSPLPSLPSPSLSPPAAPSLTERPGWMESLSLQRAALWQMIDSKQYLRRSG